MWNLKNKLWGTAVLSTVACLNVAALAPLASAQVVPPQYKVDP